MEYRTPGSSLESCTWTIKHREATCLWRRRTPPARPSRWQPAPGMSEWTVNLWRKLLSCRHCQCGRILTERTKSKRGIAAPCGWPPYTKRASHKKCSVFRLFTLGEWRTDGPRAQIWPTPGCCQAGWHSRLWPDLCCRWCQDHSYCARHYQGPCTTCSCFLTEILSLRS